MTIYVIFGVLAVLAVLIFKKSGSFFKALLTSVLGGVGALCAVGAVSYFVPVSLGINFVSLGFAALFSVPGVILMLLVKTFMI